MFWWNKKPKKKQAPNGKWYVPDANGYNPHASDFETGGYNENRTERRKNFLADGGDPSKG